MLFVSIVSGTGSEHDRSVSFFIIISLFVVLCFCSNGLYKFRTRVEALHFEIGVKLLVLLFYFVVFEFE